MLQLHHGDALTVLRSLSDASVDALITDPPYGIGLAAWDTAIDLDAFAAEAFRVTTGFYAFFGQMPTAAEWHMAALKAGFLFREHVVWVKRQTVPAGPRLGRSHEDIYIYAKRQGVKYHTVKGPYEDVKLPGVLVDTVTLEGIDRHIKDLQVKIANGGNSLMRKGGGHLVFARLNNSVGDRSPANVGYSNVWSFYPPNCAQKTGLHLHPTTKPVPVMARLCEMLTPPGGVVLDPFLGSGTTGVAAKHGGFDFIGVEQDADYLEIARARIEAANPTLET